MYDYQSARKQQIQAKIDDLQREIDMLKQEQEDIYDRRKADELQTQRVFGGIAWDNPVEVARMFR
ncbi:hypothetical protein BCM0075_p41 (plasmid) [Bacillus cereus]|uniref:hypothetical protein n=1 Tax=Bacillus mycoides TaxID=1405 RepID=UPI002E205177|nr:hypothetical protein [Bacillus mycoides]BCC21388.1 hypothetical protein BCM0075_p41 [Bacillus cereus]